MATNPTRILVAGMARLFLAPVGTAAPADATVTMPAAWKEAGLFTPDSLRFATDPNFETVSSHQSAYPTRRMETGGGATLQCDLQEWSEANFAAVYGGGTVTPITGTPTQYRWEPPVVGGRTEVEACAEVVDGLKHYRFIIPRGLQTEGVELQMQRTSESVLPFRLSVLGGDIGAAFYMVTDDPAFAPAA